MTIVTDLGARAGASDRNRRNEPKKTRNPNLSRCCFYLARPLSKRFFKEKEEKEEERNSVKQSKGKESPEKRVSDPPRVGPQKVNFLSVQLS